MLILIIIISNTFCVVGLKLISLGWVNAIVKGELAGVCKLGRGVTVARTVQASADCWSCSAASVYATGVG